MKFFLRFLLLSIIVISCDKDELIISETCSLSAINGIRNIDKYGIVGRDSLWINIDNSEYKLLGFSSSVTEKYYDYKLSKETTGFGTEDLELECLITLYYPGDSSYMNNRDYLAKFKVADGDGANDRKKDSLNFVKQCPFKLHMKITDNSGSVWSTKDKHDLSLEYYQIDSIKYVTRKFDYAQFKTFAHFQTIVEDSKGERKSISGKLIKSFFTRKK